MAETEIGVGGQAVVSAITQGSVERLELRLGDAVTAIVKASSVMIEK
jgi:molybdopterin-binding protein